MFYDLEDKKPKNSGENWVAPNAVVIGDVTLEKNSSVWFNATLRGDIENILIVFSIFKHCLFFFFSYLSDNFSWRSYN